MSEPNIFNGDPDKGTTPEAPAVTTQEPSIPPELVELVGAGKKYATVEAALKALPHSQTHISKLEAELASLRDEVSKRKTAQELLDEIKSGIPQGETTPKDGLSQDVVVQLVEKVISQKEQKQAAQSNIGKVVSTFRDAFKDKAEEQYNKLAQDAGLSVAELNRLAATSPMAVLKLAGINQAPVTPTPGKVTSDVNTVALGTQSNQELSAKVKGTSTKDVVDAWRIAGEKARKALNS